MAYMLRRDHKVLSYLLDFDEARNDGVAVASAGPYANHLQLDLDMQLRSEPHHSMFTGLCQSTECKGNYRQHALIFPPA